jgi:hypothetical protein
MTESEAATRADAGRIVGRAVLVVSALGFPLTQAVIRRFGRRGAIVTEMVCSGLLARDVLVIASGAPGRLRAGPATLLWLEAASAASAVALGAGVTRVARANMTGSPAPDRRELLRRGAVGSLFGLHTVRFRIYLSPGQGRRGL